MFRDEHMNTYTIFKSAQLFERFGALQRRRFPFHKLQEHLASKTVNALVTQISNWRTLVRVGDSAARKVKSASAPAQYDFVLMRRRCVLRIRKWMCRGNDVDLAIRPQFFNKSVDQARID